jgi:hypothetical protein|tara:strand:+ start:114 stop:362 length:249 start_codon:yes stop_codon:yes gene_type:complete
MKRDWRVIHNKRKWEMVITFQEATGQYTTEVYQGLTIDEINYQIETKFDTEKNVMIGMTMRSMPMDSVALQSHNKYLQGEGF